MKNNNSSIAVILAVVLIVVAVYVFWESIKIFFKADPNVQAAIIAAMASVILALINTRLVQRRAVFEAHKETKAKIYEEFMSKLTSLFGKKGLKAGEEKDLQEFMTEFSSRIIIYGSPEVIKAFNEWRESAADPNKENILRKTGQLLLAMRADLGESIAGLNELDIFSLYVIGGKSALRQELQG